jgi:hypothetical protein
VHFTTNMPHMWKEFAQNWMTDKTLAGTEWENRAIRDQHSAEVGAGSLSTSSVSSTPDDFANQAQARHLAGAPAQYHRRSSSTANKTARANGCRRSTIR